MCDQREQLIGYLYEESDAGERAAVQAHLDECAVCRAEIAGFRSVQEDLRAWDVPDHESVWRPFAPAPQPAWWQQVPRWAMAAAAGLVLIAGAAGGALAYLVMPPPAQTQTIVQQAQAPILQNTSAVTAADLAAAEERVMERVRLQFASFESQYSTPGEVVLTASSGTPGGDARLRQLEQQVADLRTRSEDQLLLINSFNNNIKDFRTSFDTRYARQGQRIENLASLVDLVVNK